MKTWYCKALAELTGVSVRTLHHYDKLDLLKPSLRRDNGYRLYTEADLGKLQNIIALKTFGFELTQIKELLAGNMNMVEHLKAQSHFLERKAKTLTQASLTLNEVIAEVGASSTLPWESVIKLIEVFTMTQELEKTWAGEVMTPEELKKYAEFEQYKQDLPKDQRETQISDWKELVALITINLDEDPTSDAGIKVGRACSSLLKAMYGPEHASIKKTIWEKGIKTGKAEKQTGLTPKMVKWLEKAMSAYWKDRLTKILSRIGHDPDQTVRFLWEAAQMEMHGKSEELRQTFMDEIYAIDEIPDQVKTWLKANVSS
jgi:DNA-binding transcriptional MerR regulator